MFSNASSGSATSPTAAAGYSKTVSSAPASRSREQNMLAPQSSVPEPVKPRCGAGEEIGLFGCGGATREPFECVEQHRIAAGALVDREVAFEHAAAGAEILDAGVDIGPPGIGYLTGCRRPRRHVKIEGVDDHRQP